MFNLPLLLAQEALQSASDQMLFGLEDEHRFVLLLVSVCAIAGVLIGVITSIYHAVVLIHRRNAEYDLKRDMLDRGMSAEEISQVIESAAPPENGMDRWIASWSKEKNK